MIVVTVAVAVVVVVVVVLLYIFFIFSSSGRWEKTIVKRTTLPRIFMRCQVPIYLNHTAALAAARAVTTDGHRYYSNASCRR